MAIVTFYNCDPKDAPKTTQGAHLGANAKSKVGGHIFYGTTPSGLTPT